MDKSKITKAAIIILALGGLGYIAYYFIKKGKNTSQDPEKNNRKIIQNLLNS